MVELLSAFIILSTSIAQILLKKGAIDGRARRLFNSDVICGYTLLCGAFVMSYLLMRILEVKYLSMIMCLTYGVTSLMSQRYFGNPFKKKQFMGIGLIIVGCVVFLQ